MSQQEKNDTFSVIIMNNTKGAPSSIIFVEEVDLDILHDEMLFGKPSNKRQYMIQTSIANGVVLDTSYIERQNIDKLLSKYAKSEAKTVARRTPFSGEIPEESMTWDQFIDLLSQLDLTAEGEEHLEKMAEDQDDLLIQDFSCSFLGEKLDTGDEEKIKDYEGPVFVVEETITGEIQDTSLVFVSSSVDTPTVVRRPRARTNNDPVALVIPSISYQWNDELRYWTYNEDFQFGIGIYVEDEEGVLDCVMPSITSTCATLDSSFDLAAMIFESMEDDDDEEDEDYDF